MRACKAARQLHRGVDARCIARATDDGVVLREYVGESSIELVTRSPMTISIPRSRITAISRRLPGALDSRHWRAAR
jgi:hypothetical protein